MKKKFDFKKCLDYLENHVPKIEFFLGLGALFLGALVLDIQNLFNFNFKYLYAITELTFDICLAYCGAWFIGEIICIIVLEVQKRKAAKHEVKHEDK